MGAVFLFYTEDEGWASMVSVPFADQFMTMYGGALAAIHPENADYPPGIATTYPTLESAWEAYPTCAWVYLKHDAVNYLDDYDHNQDTVYVVGHDLFGYGDSDLSNGVTVKLRTVTEPFEGHAFPTLIAAACERWARLYP